MLASPQCSYTATSLQTVSSLNLAVREPSHVLAVWKLLSNRWSYASDVSCGEKTRLLAQRLVQYPELFTVTTVLSIYSGIAPLLLCFQCCSSNLIIQLTSVDRDNSVGIATLYGLDDPGIQFRWGGESFRARPDRPWGPQSLLCNGYRVSSPGVKRPGRGVNHPPTSSAEVKERVEL